MASGKQINELTQAGSVGTTDMLAVAQPGGTEAVKASMTQIAETVADINETGALSELVYATSQGKNLLAQYLTNKGVQTSNTETLIQMADKVNNLIVQNSAELMKGYVYAMPDAASSISNSIINVLNDDFIVYINSSSVNILPRESSATDTTQWLGSAISSATYTKTITAWCKSDSGKKIAIYSSSDNTCTVFTVNPTTGVITDTTTYQLTSAPYPSSTATCCIMDDGVTWISKDTSTSYYAHVYDISAATTQEALTITLGSYARAGNLHTIGNKLIYVAPINPPTLYIYTLDYSGGTYTLSDRTTITCPSGIIRSSASQTYSDLWTVSSTMNKAFFINNYRYQTDTSNKSQQFYTWTAICVDIDTSELFYTSDIIVHGIPDSQMLANAYLGNTTTYGFNGSTTSDVWHMFGNNNPIIKYNQETQKAVFYSSLFQYGLECDLINKKFTPIINDDTPYFFPYEWLRSSPSYDSYYMYGCCPVLWRNPDTEQLFGTGSVGINNTSFSTYRITKTNGLVKNEKFIIYQKREINNTTHILDYTLSATKSDILIPAESTVTPAIPDEE